jgi:hypothetical protein
MSATGTADAVGHGLGARRHRRVVPFVAGSIACVFALVFLAGGAWALWKDRVDRDASGLRDHRVDHVAYADDAVQLMPDRTELAPTGTRVEMPGMELVRARDGKIVVDNLYYDNLAVAAQFGLLPQPATTS